GRGRTTGPEMRRAWRGAGRVRTRAWAAISGSFRKGPLVLLPERAGGPQAGRLRARVVRDLARRRRDRAAEDRLGLRGAAARAHGQVGRADAAARLIGEEALHAPVLERVERD